MSVTTLSSLVTKYKREGESRDECEQRILRAADARVSALARYAVKAPKAPKAPKARKGA